MSGYVKNNQNVVINTDKDKLVEYRSQKRQILKDREIQATIIQMKQEISLLKSELSEIKNLLNEGNKE